MPAVASAQLAFLGRGSLLISMDDTRAPAGLLEAIARSKAELEAGLTVPGEVIHQHIRDSSARIETKRSGGTWRQGIVGKQVG
jgi:hypothetical protein